MSTLTPTQEWKAKANAEYQKVMNTIITLATATLVLPTLFLKDYLGVTPGTPLKLSLKPSVYLAWLCLLLAIGAAIGFYFTSAKWLKQAYGGPVRMSEQRIQMFLVLTFTTSVVMFLAGLLLLLWFMVSAG